MEKENKETMEAVETTAPETQQEVTGQEHVMTQEEREAFVEDWNARNSEFVMRVEPPTAEELDAIAKEFEAAVNALNNKQYCIADANNAVRVASFLKKWNEEDVCWEKDLWQGTIMFDAIVKGFLEDCRKEPKDFEVNYQTLVYLFLCMQNVRGTGLKSAIHQNNINEEFVHILDTVGDLIEEYKAESKKVEAMQNRWAAMEAGYYITPKEVVDAEKPLEDRIAADLAGEADIEEPGCEE